MTRPNGSVDPITGEVNISTEGIASFWKSVNKDGPIPQHRPEIGNCWIWTGSLFKKSGYGRLKISQRMILAHRFSWILHNGQIPNDDSWYGKLCVCHHCDVRNCVRPKHLWLGTIAEDMADMVAKGRSAVGDNNGSRKFPERLKRGIENFNAKLNDEKVRQIRKRFAAGESVRGIARDFPVDPSIIRDVCIWETWRHVI